MIRPEPFQIELPGATVAGDYWKGPNDRSAALVVCHGFKGFKDWGFFPYVAAELVARTGHGAVTFNFDGSGVRESDFDDLEAFSRNTISRELWDLEAVLDGLTAGALGRLSVPPARRFGLLGHSRGGATVILKAAQRRQVEAVAAWAPITVPSLLLDRDMIDAWEAGRAVVIPNARTKQDMPLRRNGYDDFRAHGDRLDVVESARRLAAPLLVVHGTKDESVPLSEGQRIAEAAGANARLLTIEGSGHTFQVVHPFRGARPHLEIALAATAELFESVFGGSGAATEGENAQ